MSDPRSPFGNNTLIIPAYLAKGNGDDDPGFQAWKRDHPNWFVAGTWSRAAKRRDVNHPGGSVAPNVPEPPPLPIPPAHRPGAAPSLFQRYATQPFDSSTYSVAEFLKAGAEARARAHPQATPRPPNPALSHQHLPTRPARDPQMQRNINDLSTVMYNEARDVSDLAMRAVGFALRNRMRRNNDRAISDDWGGFNHHQAVARGPGDRQALAHAREIAAEILEGGAPDITNGATHFYTPGITAYEGGPPHGDMGGGVETTPGVTIRGTDHAVRNYRPGYVYTFIPRPVVGIEERFFRFYQQPENTGRVR